MKCKMTWLLLLCGLTVALLFSGCSKKKAPDGAETSADAVETVEDALPSDTPATQPGNSDGETTPAKSDETELTTGDDMETEPIAVDPETAEKNTEPSPEPDENDCNHVMGQWQISAAPGCTVEGKLTQSCTLCRIVLAEAAVPATGHVEKILPRVEPTGEADGYTEGKQCSVCGEILVRQEVIPAISGSNHTALPLPATLPTCTQIGLTEGSYCGECGEILVKQEMIPALGHSMITVPAVTPTCTAAGLTVGIACEVCQTVLVEQTEIPALGHIEVVLPAVEPTADADGWTEGRKCSTCGEVLLPQEVIPAKKHTHVPLPLAAVAPTCTQIGLTEGAYCAICNEIVLKQETIPALGHQETPVVGIPATCSATGLTDGTVCSTCGEVVTGQEIIPTLPHTIVTVPAKAPTCTEGGHSEVIYCSVCFLSVVEIQTLDSLGHKEETISAVLPTYTTWGTTEGKRCAVCQVILVAPEPVPPLKQPSGEDPLEPGGDPSGDVGTGSEGGWDGTSASYFHGGAGTENNPYLIANGEQLAHLANLINSSSNGQYAEKFFRLAGDIDLGGREWTPIGDGAGENESSERSFRGHFDGNGYTISNFRITAYNGEFVGLFGYVDGGCVENLNVCQVSIDVSAEGVVYAGGLVGVLLNGNVVGCSVEGNIRAESGAESGQAYAGGLIGEQRGGQIVGSCTDCQVSAYSEANDACTWAGGLLAYLTAEGQVEDCRTYGDVSSVAAGENSYAYAGGICGEVSQGNVDTACVAAGDVYAEGVLFAIIDGGASL